MTDSRDEGGLITPRPHAETPTPDDDIIDIAREPDGPQDRLPNLVGRLELVLDKNGVPEAFELREADDHREFPDWTHGVWISDFLAHVSPDLRRRLDSDGIKRHDFEYSTEIEETTHDQSREDTNLISETLRKYLEILRHRWPEMQAWERSQSINDAVLRLILELTEPGQGYVLKYLRSPSGDERFPGNDPDDAFGPGPRSGSPRSGPQYWLRHFGGEWVLFPPALRAKIKRFGSLNMGAPRCIDLIASTINVGEESLELAVFKSEAESTAVTSKQRPIANKGGRPAKYDWDRFHNEITRTAIMESELPPPARNAPANGRIVRKILARATRGERNPKAASGAL